MLEFIIALLLSLGIHLDDKTNLPELNQETIDVIQADSRYKELGGDEELNSLYKSSNTGSKGEDDIVPTVDPNPPTDMEKYN